MSAECDHPGDAIYWNPYDRVVQCHRCGAEYAERTRLEARLAEVEGWYQRSASSEASLARKLEDLRAAVRPLVEALIVTTAALGGAVEQIKALGSEPSHNAAPAVEKGIAVALAALADPAIAGLLEGGER